MELRSQSFALLCAFAPSRLRVKLVSFCWHPDFPQPQRELMSIRLHALFNCHMLGLALACLFAIPPVCACAESLKLKETINYTDVEFGVGSVKLYGNGRIKYALTQNIALPFT